MRRLALVSTEDQLTGKGPAALERLARTCAVESRDHFGVQSVFVTLARRAVRACVPPSHLGELLEGLDLQQKATRTKSSGSSIAQARSRCFALAPVAEEATAQAVSKASEHLRGSAPPTNLDPHAVHVIDRYVRLAAHFACAAVCHSLDAHEEPEKGLEVLGDCAAALSYQAAGLGAARQVTLRASAIDQARWEAARRGGSGESETALALQIYHEYLGGRFRAYMDVEQLKQARFIDWALSGRG